MCSFPVFSFQYVQIFTYSDSKWKAFWECKCVYVQRSRWNVICGLRSIVICNDIMSIWFEILKHIFYPYAVFSFWSRNPEIVVPPPVYFVTHPTISSKCQRNRGFDLSKNFFFRNLQRYCHSTPLIFMWEIKEFLRIDLLICICTYICPKMNAIGVKGELFF